MVNVDFYFKILSNTRPYPLINVVGRTLNTKLTINMIVLRRMNLILTKISLFVNFVTKIGLFFFDK